MCGVLGFRGAILVTEPSRSQKTLRIAKTKDRMKGIDKK
jgi:hypothetical protein